MYRILYMMFNAHDASVCKHTKIHTAGRGPILVMWLPRCRYPATRSRACRTLLVLPGLPHGLPYLAPLSPLPGLPPLGVVRDGLLGPRLGRVLPLALPPLLLLLLLLLLAPPVAALQRHQLLRGAGVVLPPPPTPPAGRRRPGPVRGRD